MRVLPLPSQLIAVRWDVVRIAGRPAPDAHTHAAHAAGDGRV
jgi:hypothetical protein